MKIKLHFLSLLLLFPLLSYSQDEEERENPMERAKFEYDMTKDPKTGLVPREELEKSRNIMSNRLRVKGAIPNVTWAERGPNTVGGRTRALMWDPNDLTKKKVWAGGVAGGLWYNNDITDVNSSWVKVDDFWDNIAVGDITFDPMNKQIMYVGTGERSSSDNIENSSGSGTGGGGIWKSTNGGTNWARVTSTIPDYANSNDAAGWREVLKIVVNQQGHVFALNYWGVAKSTNGGGRWDYLTGTNAPPSNFPRRITDIELGTDGILYIAQGGATAGSGVPTTPVIYKSTDNTTSAFSIITPPGTFDKGRVEIVLAPNTSGATQTVYAVAASSDARGVRFFKKSVDAGREWTDVVVPTDVDARVPKPSFTAEQGDYNLILGVKADDANVIYAGGTTIGISYSGGVATAGNPAWKHEFGTNYFYEPNNKFFVDNHAFAGRPGFPKEAIFGNDGGVFYSADWGDANVTEPNFQRRTKGYNVTQFYSVGMGSASNSGLLMGGAQDNGTQIVNSAYGTQGSGFEIAGGDGGLNFIDQEDENILISSYIHVSYELHPNGPANKSKISFLPHDKTRGNFINQADYDSPNNTLYVNYSAKNASDVITEAKIIRYTIAGTAPNYTTNSSILTLSPLVNISLIKVGKTSGSIFIGTTEGQVYKGTGIPASGNQNVTLTLVMDNANTSTGYVSSIDFGTNENTMVVAKSNYNIKSVYYTTTGGGTNVNDWISKDEDTHGLPNVPIRYVLINPVDNKQVLLATELGVWSTSDITAISTAANPLWQSTNTSLANVRCDMLRFRASDNTVAVATHGRGFFTTQINQQACTPPTNVIARNNSPIILGRPIELTSSATGGTSYRWVGPNGYTSTERNPNRYSTELSMAGVYTVTITSSGTCTATATTNVVLNCEQPMNPSAVNNSPVNVGGSFFLNAAIQQAGISFRWTGPNGFTTSERNPTIPSATLAMAGIYTVTVTGAGTCTGTATATTNVVVNCTPPTNAMASSNSSVNVGAAINFSASATGGTSYRWAGPSSFSSMAQNPSIASATSAMAGVYTVTITSSGTCTATATTNVVVNVSIDPCALVVDLQLVKAGNPHQPMFSLTNGMTINPIANEVSILAVPICPTILIESFSMSIASSTINVTNIQNVSSYALFDNLNTNIYGRVLPAGTYTVTITGYSQDNQQGMVLYGPVATTFTILPNTASISTPTVSQTGICSGSNVDVTFTTSGTYNAGNQFYVELSDENGNFATIPQVGNTSISSTYFIVVTIGTGSMTGTIPCTIPSDIAGGTNYRVRVVSTNGVSSSLSNTSPITIHPKDLVLVNPTDNYNSNIGIKQASQTITATNKINSPAKVIYQAGKNIVLNAGFEANSNATFQAKITGCN